MLQQSTDVIPELYMEQQKSKYNINQMKFLSYKG